MARTIITKVLHPNAGVQQAKKSSPSDSSGKVKAVGKYYNDKSVETDAKGDAKDDDMDSSVEADIYEKTSAWTVDRSQLATKEDRLSAPIIVGKKELIKSGRKQLAIKRAKKSPESGTTYRHYYAIADSDIQLRDPHRGYINVYTYPNNLIEKVRKEDVPEYMLYGENKRLAHNQFYRVLSALENADDVTNFYYRDNDGKMKIMTNKKRNEITRAKKIKFAWKLLSAKKEE